MQNPPPVVTISPRGRLVTSGSVTVDVTWCMPWGGSGFQTQTLTLDYVNVNSSFSYLTSGQNVDCDYYEVWQGTLSLNATPEMQTFRAVAVDWLNYQGEDQVTFAVPSQWSNVLVSPGARFVDVVPGSSGNTQVFTVWNTGAVNAAYTLSVSCAGAATPSTCSLSTGSLSVNAGSSNSATVTFTASGTAADTAVIKVIATDNVSPFRADTGWTDVTVKPAPSTGVTVSRSLATLHRGACVTVSVASDAAMECGDLRITHALPGVTTMGRARIPTLIYSSALARPIPVAQADVTIPCSLPTTAEARVYIGGVQRGYRSFAGSDWGSCGSTRRVSVDIDASAYGTSLQSYSVQLAFSGGAGGTYTSPTEKLSIVDRSSSGFGAGWWLAGLEKLTVVDGSTLLWIGGDGSTAVYSGGGATFVAAAFDRPDTITYDGGTGEYTRQGAGTADVRFNSSGYHVSTTNRQGHVTRFTYVPGTDRLDSLVLPVRSGAPLAYKFVYTSNLLDSVIAPAAGVGRNVKINRSGAAVTSIRDADGTTVSFGYLGGSNANVITNRVDRRSNTTHFTYNSVNHLTRDSLHLGSSQFIRQVLRPAESASLSTALPVDSTYTRIDGPRTDVADETKIWVNRFGQPLRVRDAEGGETAMRYDATWPGLVTETRSASRQLTRAFYSASTGLVDSTVAYKPMGGSNAMTTYTWNTTWRAPVSITNPMGVIDSMGYDGSGNRIWAQTGGSARRVNFTYTSDHLDSAITLPSGVGSPVTRMGRNALGNVSTVTNPKGYVSFSYQDAIGRDTLSATPLGDTTNATTFNAGHYSRVRRAYSRAGRDSVTTTMGPSVTLPSPYPATGADSLRLEHFYDNEGNVTTTRRKFTNGGTWTLDNTSTYDAAGRVTYSTTPSSSTTYTLDPAGNVTAVQNGRGNTVSMEYDKANRLLKRITPQVTYSSIACSSLPINWPYGCNYSLPTIGSSVCVDADTAYFSYDGAGRMRRAYNKYARIERGYNQNGSLSGETQKIRSYYEAGNTACHTAPAVTAFGGSEFQSFVTAYSYDLAGNRTGLEAPTGTACSGACTMTWTFSGTTGLLTSVAEENAGTVSFSHDDAGRLTGISFPGSWTDSRTLDALGNTSSRTVSGGSTAISDAMAYDAAGRIKQGTIGYRDGVSWGSTVDTWYGPLGAVVAASGAMTATGGTTIEQFTVDALGNRRQSQAKNMRATTHPDVDGIRDLTYNSGGQLTNVLAPAQTSGFYSNKDLAYDASGNLDLTTRTEMDYWGGGNVLWDATKHYYNAADKLVVLNRAIGPYANDESHPAERNVFEEYRYDALNRRVGTRSRRTSSCSTASNSECVSAWTRTVWDGDQVLMEIRTPGHTNVPVDSMEATAPVGPVASAYPFGRVMYLHAGSIDQPVAVIRYGLASITDPYVVYPHANWRGQYEAGHKPDGTKCYRGSSCVEIDWPGAITQIDGGKPNPVDGAAWFGSLVTGNTDGSGQSYLRNRYYDPATGRFTQEDPIGLAGGMNLYGFAGGDRVNFSDPFGLCPVCIVAGVWALYELGSSAYDVYTAGKTLASPTASGGDKAAAVGLAALSVIGPGGGYTAALDDLSDAAKALDRGGLTKAGRAYEKHAGRTSSKAMGNIAAKNAAGQALVDDILTSPGARTVPLTTGRFRGGFDIYAPDGRGVRYDKSGGFVGLLEPPRK